MDHEALFTDLKKTLAAFMESTEVDKTTLKDQLEELRDNIEDHIVLLEEELQEAGEEG